VAPRDGQLRLRRTWPQRLVIALGIFLVAMLVMTATGVGYVYWKTGKLPHIVGLPVTEAAPGEPANYLVVGSDSRDVVDQNDPNADAFFGEEGYEGKRSDTIMVARIDPETNQAALLSFPRDLWVPISGTGENQRINTAYGLGRDVLINTIQDTFGITINHYIEVDFRGFQGLVSAIDGVPMYFDSAFRDRNSGLNIPAPGCVTLDGTQALAFARSRHLEFKTSRGWQTDPTGDLGRITRQQIFVEKALDRALARGLTNPITFNRLLDVALENVAVDEGLDAGDLLNLVQRFKEFDPDSLATYAIPNEPFRTNGGAAVLHVNEREAEPILNIFRGLPPDAVSEAGVSATVLNGSGAPGQAGKVATALEAVGFTVDGTGNAEMGVVPRTLVRYAPGSENAADLVARHLTSGALLEEDPSLGQNDVVVITGTDFTTVMEHAAPPATTTTTTSTPSSSGDSSSTTTVPPSTTSTSVVGITPGQPPVGVTC
jgi:LCP family protein required for cell wall assembly